MTEPYSIISKFISDFSKKKLYICNRDLNCECIGYCVCNSDDLALIDLNINLITNNECIIKILLKENIKLNKNYDWCIFYLTESEDVNIINIELINKKIKLYFNDTKNNINHPNKYISFQFNNKPKQPDKNNIIITFNYNDFKIN
jgi:hypothetical protein